MGDVLLVIASAIWVKLLVALVDGFLFGESSELLWWRGHSRSLSRKEAVARAVLVLGFLITASSLLLFALCSKNISTNCINTYNRWFIYMLVIGLIEAVPPILSKRIGDDK